MPYMLIYIIDVTALCCATRDAMPMRAEGLDAAHHSRDKRAYREHFSAAKAAPARSAGNYAIPASEHFRRSSIWRRQCWVIFKRFRWAAMPPRLKKYQVIITLEIDIFSYCRSISILISRHTPLCRRHARCRAQRRLSAVLTNTLIINAIYADAARIA